MRAVNVIIGTAALVFVAFIIFACTVLLPAGEKIRVACEKRGGQYVQFRYEAACIRKDAVIDLGKK